MNNRYKVRIYESGDHDGSIAPGTVVMAVDRCFSLDARSPEEAERKIQEDVAGGKLRAGRVYQITPRAGNPDAIRAIAICMGSSSQQVHLDDAKGLYSEFRRIRYAECPAAAA